MIVDRLPSFLLSLCLHMGVVLLAILWPGPGTYLPETRTGVLVSGLVTIGAPGKSTPGAQQEIPEAKLGRTEKPAEQPAQPQEPAQTARAESPKPVETVPEVAPVQKTPVKEPDTSATPIPKEPDKLPVQEPPKKEEPKKDEPKLKEKPKPEEPLKPKEEPKPKTEPKKEEPKKPKPAKKNEKVDIEKELRDLARKEGIAQGSRQGRGTARQGSGSRQSATDNALAELRRETGGAGTDAGGRGPGGRGGDGLGTLGNYEQSVVSRVRPNWANVDRVDRTNYVAVVNISIAQDGTIRGARIIAPSGNNAFDISVINAIAATKNLEPPQRPEDMEINIRFSRYALSGQ